MSAHGRDGRVIVSAGTASVCREAGFQVAVLGIDGCRGGWAVVRLGDGPPEASVHDDLAGIERAHGRVAAALIDMPIGLPQTKDARCCDALARRLLGPRRASVFPVPCREAVYAPDYASACERNLLRLGRRLSRQSWNICRRIAEVDSYLHRGGGLPLVESHPELCFAALQGAPMAIAKRSVAGRRERLSLLVEHLPGALDWFAEANRRFRRLLAPDDLLDALVLAVSAGEPLTRVPDRPPRDARGLPMAIAFPDWMQPARPGANRNG